jgi:hypothetical protein
MLFTLFNAQQTCLNRRIANGNTAAPLLRTFNVTRNATFINETLANTPKTPYTGDSPQAPFFRAQRQHSLNG